MLLQDREILVTNDNTNITYVGGNWATVQASAVNSFGVLGSAFSPTLHSTTTASSFTFPFHGSSINVYGTANIANSLTNPDPTWQCFVDGINLGSPDIVNNPENNWSLCSQGNIPDGAHELVVNVTSRGMPFYLDYIKYRPSSGVSLENSFIVIQNDDSAIDYTSGWDALEGIANQTTNPKSPVNVTFVGTQLSWYGFIPDAEPHNASSGEYSIDGQLPYSPFQLLGLPLVPSASSLYNQLFFTTQTLEMGSHTLSAKYTGSPGQTPFTLDFLIVTNGSFPLSTNPSPHNSTNSRGAQSRNSTSSPAPLITNNISSKRSSHVGNIAGGAVGGIGGVVILCSIIIFFKLWSRSRKRRRRNRVNDNEVTRHSVNSIEPFSIQPQLRRFISKSQVASGPLLAPNQTVNAGEGGGASHTHHHSQLIMSLPSNSASSSNNSPFTTDETFGNRPRCRPLPAPIQLIPSVGSTPTITSGRHEDSSVRLSQPVLDEIVADIPPMYSEH